MSLSAGLLWGLCGVCALRMDYDGSETWASFVMAPLLGPLYFVVIALEVFLGVL